MASTAYSEIALQFDADSGIARIELDRPDSLNAISEQMATEILAGFDRLQEIDAEHDGAAVRAVVVEGRGEKAFSVGADLNEEAEVDPYDKGELLRWRRLGTAVEECSAPVVGKIDGYCLGGGLELALAFDFRLATANSELGLPEIDVGIYPAGGGTQRLTALVGPHRAKELCITGESISGEQAAADGIVTKSFPQGEFEAGVEAFLDTITSKPPLAVRAVKDSVNFANEAGVSTGIRYEQERYRPLLQSDDYQEGMAAFAENRDPNWSGR